MILAANFTPPLLSDSNSDPRQAFRDLWTSPSRKNYVCKAGTDSPFHAEDSEAQIYLLHRITGAESIQKQPEVPASH